MTVDCPTTSWCLFSLHSTAVSRSWWHRYLLIHEYQIQHSLGLVHKTFHYITMTGSYDVKFDPRVCDHWLRQTRQRLHMLLRTGKHFVFNDFIRSDSTNFPTVGTFSIIQRAFKIIGDQTSWQEHFYRVNRVPRPDQTFVTQMLTRELFVVANLVYTSPGSPTMILPYAIFLFLMK